MELAFFKKTSKTALIVEERLTAFIETICIRPATAPSKSIFTIIRHTANDTVDQTGPSCASTAHVSVALIAVFLAIPATWESLFFLDSVRPWSTIIFSPDKQTSWLAPWTSTSVLTKSIAFWTLPTLLTSRAVLVFLYQCPRRFPAYSWPTKEKYSPYLGICSCTDGFASFLADQKIRSGFVTLVTHPGLLVRVKCII